MRIATYNIWNTDDISLKRIEAICEEIGRIRADIIALQEVRSRISQSDNRNIAKYIAENTNYRHAIFKAYPNDPDEGLAFLSQVPIASAEAGWETSIKELNCVIRIVASINGTDIALTNVHLDSEPEPITTRESQITAIVEWISCRFKKGCHEIVCGDFNCYPDSSVHKFLLGQQSLQGKSTSWFDLAMYYANCSDSEALPTLNFNKNPRWITQHTLEIPARCDWIMLRDCYPEAYPYVDRVEIFGIEPTPKAQLVPSDHYGIFADIRLQ